MELKERSSILKEKTDKSRSAGKFPLPAEIFLSALLGYFAAGTDLGGSGAPFCAAAAAVLPPIGGIAAFAGTMSALLLTKTINSFVTEIIAMPAIVTAKILLTYISGKKHSPVMSAVLSGAAYLICGIITVVSFGSGYAPIPAVIFRSMISAAAAFLTEKTFSAAKNGTVFSHGNRISLSAVFVMALCMLCGINIGSMDLGRTAGAFISLAAAYRYGSGAAGTAAALTAFASGIASRTLLPPSPIMICSAMAAGIPDKGGKLSHALVFVGFGLSGTLMYGIPSDAAELLADMTAAAVIFCVLPEKIYRKAFAEELKHHAPVSVPITLFGEKLRFAAAAVSEIKESYEKAAEVLAEKERPADISRDVCEKVCSRCKSSAFCGENAEHRIENYFRPMETVTDKNGILTEKELHHALGHCPHKQALTEAFNSAYGKMLMEKRFADMSASLREITSEHLEGTEKMLSFLGGRTDIFPFCDERVSVRINGIISDAGAKDPHSALFSDRAGRVYIECFYEGMLNVSHEELTEMFSRAADRELAMPAAAVFGGITRLCFHEQECFSAEIGSAAANGREETGGDFGTVFHDGLGSVSIILSDGMGSGARAAVESCMTVSVIARMIKAGLGAEAAVRITNLLLLTKSPEECFSTIDLLTIDLFTGSAELIKLGAAQSFVKSCGTVKTVESRTAPVGMISPAEIDRRTFRLSDGDEVVMITDGICEECFPRIRELMLSMGVTARDCAERIISAAEDGKENNIFMQDDKTVYAVKLHKI